MKIQTKHRLKDLRNWVVDRKYTRARIWFSINGQVYKLTKIFTHPLKKNPGIISVLQSAKGIIGKYDIYQIIRKNYKYTAREAKRLMGLYYESI